MNRIINRLKYQLERLVLRGALYRLLLIVLIMAVLSFTAGILVYLFADFGGVAEAIWWAFLRLTDPGYLGDDEGVFVRAVSTFLTIAGFVLFVGAIIAILTQWLNQTMESLGRGYTPVALRNHVVLLGWTNRTATIVGELLRSEARVRRFLRLHGARGLRIAILAEEEPEDLVVELRDRLGDLWDEDKVILRFGNALRLEHLLRVDFMNAAAILLPAPEFSDRQIGADTQVMKTLLSLANHPAVRDGRTLPLLVAEIFDGQKIRIARNAYGGRIELLASDSIISRLIAQNVRHRGLSRVYGELLAHGWGNEVYVREASSFAGERFHDLARSFPLAVPLGVVRKHGRSFTPILNPPSEFVLDKGDRLILLARSYDDSTPVPGRPPSPVDRGETAHPFGQSERELRILLLGWSHRVPSLVHEFGSYPDERFQIDILSVVDVAERDRAIGRRGVVGDRLRVTQLEGDYTSPAEVHALDPSSYDNIVFIGSDWMDSGEEADARTILGYLTLRDLLPRENGPEILLELLDPENLSLFARRRGEVIISPLILSHMLAQVALRPELRTVFDELFGPGGAEITFHSAGLYGEPGEEMSFAELTRRAAARGEIALGVRDESEGGPWLGQFQLNPPRDARWKIGEDGEVIVLTTY